MSQSRKTRHRTQMFVAQRTRRSAKPTPPPEPVVEPEPPAQQEEPSHASAHETPYNVHDKPTLPMGHYAALADNFTFHNPFEREHTADGSARPATRDATAHLGRTAAMLEDAQPLLMHDTPIDQLSSWCIAHVEPAHDHPVIAWLQDDSLHLRDERTIHHIIGLSDKRLVTMHHDARYTWFATDKGRLFRFDRAAKKLSLASELPHREPIVFIHSALEKDLVLVVSRDGKIYTTFAHTPHQLERTARSLPSSIIHGAFDPLHDELILVTTTSRVLRVPLTAGTPPQGSSITSANPITALHFSPADRLLHVQLAQPDRVQTYQWDTTPRKMFSTTLPEGHHGVYLNPYTQQMQMLCARGSVLLHTTLM